MMTEQPIPAIGTQYPLLFSYRETFFGNGFLVEVQATNGRALCIRESEDEYWVYGINPGGMAAYGADPDSAYAAFRRAFSHVLVDLASSAVGFEEFRTAVQTCFADTNVGYESVWKEALGGVQRGEVTLDGVPIVPANSPRTIAISIKRVEQVTAQDNSPNVQYLLAA